MAAVALQRLLQVRVCCMVHALDAAAPLKLFFKAAI